MGFFQGILNLTPKAQKLKKEMRKAERRAADNRIYSVQRAMDFRKTEDPREMAHMNQSLWGRGLGKSSIADQDKDRLRMIQAHRNTGLTEAMDMAIRGKKIVKAKAKYARRSQYIEMLDSIISLAAGAGGSGAGQIGGGGTSGDGGGVGSNYGMGDYNYGGDSSFG